MREEKPGKDRLHELFRLWLDRNPTLNLNDVLAEDETIGYDELNGTM